MMRPPGEENGLKPFDHPPHEPVVSAYQNGGGLRCPRTELVFVAVDTVPALIAGLDAPVNLSFRVTDEVPLRDIRSLPAVTHAEVVGDRVSVQGSGERFQQEVLQLLATHGLWAQEIRTERASLEAVFLKLSGERPEGLAA